MFCKNVSAFRPHSPLLAITGCGRPLPNDPAPNMEAASKIRATLVSASKSTGGGEATATEAAPQATGAGAIKGRFVYEGQAPAPSPISVTKDQEVCGQHHLMDESLLKSTARVAWPTR